MGSVSSTLPPGPRLPKWVQTAGFLLGNRRWVDWNRRRYGDMVTFQSLFDPCFVMVFEPELVKQVFRGKPDNLRAGEANAVLGPVVGEHSLLLLDGAEHLHERKLLLPPFHGERMRAYQEVMREAADKAIDTWPVGETFELLPQMRSVTLDIILRAVFGVQEGARFDELKRALRDMIDPAQSVRGVLLLGLTGGRFGSGATERFERQRAAVDALIYDEIARRREAPDLAEREDIFSMLLLARDENGEGMTDVELRDELVTLLVAGHETTATGLAWAFELLLRNPRVLNRLRVSLANDEIEYLDAVIKETLRIRPVVLGVGRKVREQPFELGGYTIPVGVELNPSIGAIHRRGDRFPSPGEFRPERFLVDDAPDTYTWLPFGGGTRRCIGASFAMFEMRIVISRVLERAALLPVDSKPETGVRRGVTYNPKRGVRVRLKEPALPAPSEQAVATSN